MLKELDPRVILVAVANGWGSNLLALTCQTLVFIMSGRLLGLDGYGTIVAAASFSLILGPWSGIGFDFVALQAIARDHVDCTAVFNRGKKLITLTASLIIVVLASSLQLLAVDSSMIIVLCSVLTADLYFLRKTDLCIRIHQGLQNFKLMNISRLSTYVVRLTAFTAIFLTYDDISPATWSFTYLASAAISSQFALSLFSKTKINNNKSRETNISVREGIHFAGGLTSNRLYSELDKILLLNISGALSAGMHGVACRIINIVVLPMTSFTNVILPLLYKLRSQEKPQDDTKTTDRILVLSFIPLIYGIIIGSLTFTWGGSVIIWLFGEEYRAVNNGMLAISFLPAISACRSFFEEALAVIDRLTVRSRIQWFIAVFAIISNFYAIQQYGWLGALRVMLTSEVLLCGAYLFLFLRKPRNSNKIPHAL